MQQFADEAEKLHREYESWRVQEARALEAQLQEHLQKLDVKNEAVHRAALHTQSEVGMAERECGNLRSQIKSQEGELIRLRKELASVKFDPTSERTSPNRGESKTAVLRSLSVQIFSKFFVLNLFIS